MNEILKHFQLETREYDYGIYGSGHINVTYLVEHRPRYILQKINTEVFKNPEGVMENILAVTTHLRAKIAAAGGNPDRGTLTPILTHEGKAYWKEPDGSFYRVYLFIEDAVTYDQVENADQLYYAAREFGKFQNMLADFPAETLFDVIPHFHDTRDRFRQLSAAVENNLADRRDAVAEEIAFAMAREADTDVVLDAIRDGSVPLRVTHNDTKLNNVMLDPKTGEGVCVVDLDTVMPGSLLYDFGDALRFGASSAAEDETDLDKVFFRLDYFEAYVRGFVEELGSKMTAREIELLPFSVKLLTFECGMRFLADYLNGDTYFRIHRPDHNLDRCRTQFKLVADIEAKMDEMRAIVAKYI